MPDVSIIIVSWNARNFLIECLNSIQNSLQNLSLEIIVIDNASSDGSADAVEQYHPYVNLIRNDINSGFAEGNNIGIRHCNGRYICLINSMLRSCRIVCHGLRHILKGILP